MGRFLMGEARLYGSIHGAISFGIDEGRAVSFRSIVGDNDGISWSFLSVRILMIFVFSLQCLYETPKNR